MFGITPKEIILKQLQKRFKDTGFKQVMFTYTVATEKTTCKGLTVDNLTEPLEVEQSENNLIKNTLVKHIRKALDFEFTHLVASIDVESNTITMGAKNLEGVLIPIKV